MKKTVNTIRNSICEIFKSLRLPGMIEAYREQWDDPKFAELSFDERLYAIAKQEDESRCNRRQLRFLKESGMYMQMASFENLDLTKNRGINKSLIEELKTCDWMITPAHPSLLISGPTGTGKTFLAQCFGKAACMASLSTAYFRVPQFFELLTDATDHKQAARFRKRINNKKLLILDDFAMTPISEELSRDLLTLLVEREGVGTTIITSQLPIEQWHSMIKQVWDADAIIDRMLGASYRIELKGESRRMKKLNA